MHWQSFREMTLYHAGILWFLLICNVLGTLYGYIWYLPQLSQTEWYFWPFVPDSPTASLFLSVSIALLLIQKHSPLIDTLGFVTLIKYGVWAVIMNIFTFIHDDTIYWQGLMLIMSHGIMAIQAWWFLPRFKFTLLSFIITMIWVFHNDVIDYVFHQYPVYGSLMAYESIIGYVAFWLSCLPLAGVLYIFYSRQTKSFDHH